MSAEAPKWRRIADSLEQYIENTGLKPGDQLPTEAHLTALFGVNRHTLRRALRVLEESGRLEARQGRGRFVRLPAIPYPLLEFPRFSNLLTDMGIAPHVEVRGVVLRRGTDLELLKLKLREGSKVVEVRRQGFAAALPVSQSLHIFPANRLARTSLETSAWHSVTEALRKSGIQSFRRLETQITARLPTAPERASLHLPRHVPVLVTESLNVDERGWPIELGRALLASDRVALELSNRPSRATPPATDRSVTNQALVREDHQKNVSRDAKTSGRTISSR